MRSRPPNAVLSHRHLSSGLFAPRDDPVAHRGRSSAKEWSPIRSLSARKPTSRLITTCRQPTAYRPCSPRLQADAAVPPPRRIPRGLSDKPDSVASPLVLPLFRCSSPVLRLRAVAVPGDVDQRAAQPQLFLPMTVCQEAVVTHADETAGQHVQQEPPDEFDGRQRHRLRRVSEPPN